MNLGLSRNQIRLFLAACASGLLMVSFQNCGKAGFDADLESYGSPGLSDAALVAKYGATAAGKVQGTPFAYEVSADTITYNSCAARNLKNYESRGFSSIMIGAFQNGGVRLNGDFFDYVNRNFNPTYGYTGITENQYKSILADSPANADTFPTASIRVKNSLTDVYTADNSLLLGRDVVPLSSNLSNSLLMDTLFQNQTGYTSYFPFAPDYRKFNARLTFNTDEMQADRFRGLLSNEAVLALTFLGGSSQEIYRIRPDGGYPTTRAHGKGYQMQFGQPASVGSPTHHNVPNRVLHYVEEVDLQTGQRTGTFACRYYAVVRSQDAAIACPALTANQLANSNIQNELKLFRRHLRADHWDVNPAVGCVVPKQTSCYEEENYAGKTNGQVAEVDYNPVNDCHTPTNTAQVGSSLISKCAHYITVCTKN